MKLIASGATADVFLNNENRIIKLFKNQYSEKIVQKEANSQKIIYETGLPVPKIFGIKKIDGRYGIIMENIKGMSIGEKILKTNNYTDKLNIEEDVIKNWDTIMHYLSLTIDIQIKINAIKVQDYPLMKDRLVNRINLVRYITEKQKIILLKKLESIEFNNYLCHGDLHPFNIIETDEGIKVIDWADSTIGNREADVCRSYIIYEKNMPKISDKYLELYCKKASIDKENVLMYKPIIIAARLAENIPEKEKSELINDLQGYIKR
ncbi:MAG: aminoglycoside phosphotransferase family protein [Treponema sp.]|jgi:thiamine kinase-like enzyme|nr:aminoglycoside phosphotransferase family protein [Treponema sp.]